MKRIFLLLACFFLTSSVECQDWRRTYIDIDLGYTVGRFIGLEENYAELGLFAAPQLSTQWQPLLDVRGYKLEYDNQYAASAGVGMRRWDYRTCRYWGANIYYDYRSGCRNSFHRLGLGFESLGPYFDFRANGYFPFKSTHQSPAFRQSFLGNFKASCRTKEFTFVGGDMELGLTLWSECYNLLYGAVGPYYYYSNNVDDFAGVFGRLEVHIERFFRLEGLISYDRKFKTQVQGCLVFSIPLGYSCCDDECTIIRTQRVRRNNVIFTKRCCDWHWNWK